MSENQFLKIDGSQTGTKFIGLVDKSESFAVFKVSKGYNFKGFVCESGYWAVTVLGPIELHKNKTVKNIAKLSHKTTVTEKKNEESGFDRQIREKLHKDPSHITLQDIMDIQNRKILD